MNNTNTTLEKAILLLKKASGALEEICSDVGCPKETVMPEIDTFIARYELWKQERPQHTKVKVHTAESLFDIDNDCCEEEVIKISDLDDQQLQLLGLSHS